MKNTIRKPARLVTCLAMGSLAGLALTMSSCETYDRTTVYSVGTTYNTLPRRYRTVELDGSRYYYSSGSYFQRRGDRYVVVERPLRYPTTTAHVAAYGTFRATLPPRHRTVRYGNRTYYYADGSYYRSRGQAYVTVRDPFH